MRLGKVAAWFVLAFVVLSSLASAQPVRRQAVEGQVLVKFKTAVSASARTSAHKRARGRVVSEIAGRGVALVTVAAGDEQAAAARYRRNANVLFAEPNYVRYIPEPTAQSGDAPLIPRDKYFGQQWGFHNTGQEFYCFEVFGNLCFFQGTPNADINAPEAWAITTGSPAVTVAVIDTGIDYTHPDLAQHYAGGYDFVHSTFDPLDDHGHGTHVAGTIAASFENMTGNPGLAEGVVGVAPQARLLAYKVCAADGTCEDFAVIQAINRAVADGAKVINMSLGDTAYSQALADAVQAAWNAGVVIVAGAGNDGVTAPFYPAALEHVVAVGAFDEFHKRASFSNYGNWVSIAAPGSNILSTYPLSKCQEAGVAGDMGCYAWLSGTSMATPHVSGAAALLWSRGDVTTNQQVVDLLLQNADPAGVSNVRLDSWTAHGGLNLHDAVAGGSATGKPVANAGPDQAVIDGDGNGVELVSLDGSASHDDNGALVAYDWREGTTVIGSGATVAATLAVGTHTLTLEVTDNDGLTATDTIVVTVQARSRVSVTASTPQAREAGLQPGVFTLTRDGDISGALAISYAVNGSATPGADYQPLSGAALFAAGVATVTVQVLPIDDDLSESNELVVLALSPGNGYVVGTPSSASVTVVSDDLPADLSISAATAPAMGGADRDLVVTDTTKNQGSGAAPDSSTGFYLSTNTSFDASDIFLGSRPVPRLDPAAVHSASTTLHIPAGTLSGSYYVIAKADSIDAVSESVETNNVRATAVVKIGPDLLVTVFTTPTTLVGGATFSVTDTTTNQGGGQADVSVTRYYLSTNSTLDANDVLLGSRPLAELSPGASDTGSAVLTLPPNMPGGSYYVVAQADGGTVVTEISESNNTKVGSAIKIGADLIASALNIPAMASIGGSFTITESTTNQGAGPVADSATGFFLSNDAGSDGGDVFLGARSVGVLATGAVSSGVTSVQIPAGTAPGTYYIVSKADWANLIFESVESNNTRVASIRIGPDLSQMSITGPSTAAAGSSFSASDVVSNQGSDGVGVSTTRYYLSTNSSLDAGDVLLASRVVPALAPGTSDNGAVVLAIPPQTVPGKYFIVVAADADGIVAEAVENNNSKGRNITITAH